MGGTDRRGAGAWWVVVAVLVVIVVVVVGSLGLIAGSGGGGPGDQRAAVSEREAMTALDGMAALASQRTPKAMAQLCELSLDECAGFSGGVITAPDGAQSAPAAGSVPALLCSRDVGDGAWMLVVEGVDGLGRDYVSQVVLGRDGDGRVVPVREPAFWLGVAYAGTKVTGSTSWSTAYTPEAGTSGDFTEKMLQRARAACTDGG
jgi:hypothetical protein